MAPLPTPPTAPLARLFFLDNLRAFAIVLVVVLHASITYMAYGPAWWYVVDPDQSLGWTALVLVLDVAIMPTMFLVAGYFALPSLRRRGAGGFVREKLTRIGIPWVIGVLVLAPIVAYIGYASRDIPMGYLEFWAGEFWGPAFQQSVYWFLGVLLVLFLLLAAAWALSPRLAAPASEPAPPARWVLPAVALLTAAWAVLLSPVAGIDTWTPVGWAFVIQPARIGMYAVYFALGIHAERHGWLRADGWRPNAATWLALAFTTGFTYLAFRLAAPGDDIAARSVTGILFAAYCLSAVVAAVGAFARWGNWSGRAWRTLSANSFGIYYVHPLVLYPLAWLLVGVALPSLAKVAILVLVTVLASLAISAVVLRRLPGLRRLF